MARLSNTYAETSPSDRSNLEQVPEEVEAIDPDSTQAIDFSASTLDLQLMV
ncbi:MAG TPA: hypothetical protein V6C84_15255 [Coleofasciculaceae cyanobacterium]|jgi:hypothetical protein